jgi:hypothetical protein
MKSDLRKQTIMPHKMPWFLGRWMGRVHADYDRENDNADSLEDRKTQFSNVGLSRLHATILQFVKPGFCKLIETVILNAVQCYKEPRRLLTFESFDDALTFSTPESERFKILLHGAQDEPRSNEIDVRKYGCFFCVEARAINSRKELVAVLPNGSFASTNGGFAAFGFPDVFVWTLVSVLYFLDFLFYSSVFCYLSY